MNDRLTERDYAEIRAAVMKTVRSPRPLRRHWVYAAAAAAVLLGVVLFRNEPPPAQRPRVVPKIARLAPSVAAAAPSSAAAAAPPAAVAAPPREVPAKRLPAPRRPPRPRAAPAVQTASFRIDIQTADPNIRIIWFAR